MATTAHRRAPLISTHLRRADAPFCGVVRTCGGEGMRQGGYGSRAGSRGGRGRGPQSLAGLCSAYAQSCEGTACMRVTVGSMDSK
jgi:hypothetical protein